MEKRNNIPKRIESILTDFRSMITRTDKGVGITVNVLIKEEADLFVAHCLELDLVATADSLNAASKDIADLILTQIDYAFSHDNLDYLYHSAPASVWEEFFHCKKFNEKRHIRKPWFKTMQATKPGPPRIITNTCLAPKAACGV